MKLICTKCNRFIPLYDIPLFFVGEILLSIMGITKASYVCSRCSKQESQLNGVH
jgi:hypothetical protein